jgi:predicted esterase
MKPEAVAWHLPVRKTARVYRLGEVGAATRELWVVCHGYGQLAGRFIQAFASIASDTRAILAPEGLHRFYLDPPDRPAAQRRVGATWMTREDREHDIEDNTAYLDTLIHELRRSAPDAALTVLGFSQGAATMSRWAVASELAVARLIVWGAELPPDLDWHRARSRLATTPLLLVMGERDEYMTPGRIAEHRAHLDRHGIPHAWTGFPGGHAIDEPTLARLAGS